MRKPKSVVIDLSIDWGEETEFLTFPNVQQFADYLRFHPDVGEQLGYVPKGPHPGIPYKQPKTVTSQVVKREHSQYNGGKKAAMQFRNEVNGAIERGEMKMPEGWDKDLP